LRENGGLGHKKRFWILKRRKFFAKNEKFLRLFDGFNRGLGGFSWIFASFDAVLRVFLQVFLRTKQFWNYSPPRRREKRENGHE